MLRRVPLTTRSPNQSTRVSPLLLILFQLLKRFAISPDLPLLLSPVPFERPIFKSLNQGLSSSRNSYPSLPILLFRSSSSFPFILCLFLFQVSSGVEINYELETPPAVTTSYFTLSVRGTFTSLPPSLPLFLSLFPSLSPPCNHLL